MQNFQSIVFLLKSAFEFLKTDTWKMTLDCLKVLILLFDTLYFPKTSLCSVVLLEILIPLFTHLFVLFYVFWIGSSRSLPGKFSRYVVVWLQPVPKLHEVCPLIFSKLFSPKEKTEIAPLHLWEKHIKTIGKLILSRLKHLHFREVTWSTSESNFLFSLYPIRCFCHYWGPCYAVDHAWIVIEDQAITLARERWCDLWLQLLL